MQQTDRRRFLAGSAAVAGGALAGLTGCDGGSGRSDAPDASGTPPSWTGSSSAAGSAPSSTPVDVDPGDLATWRSQFSLRTDVAHFDAWTLAAHPRAVTEAIERHRAGLDEDTASYQHEHELESIDAARQAAARYLEVRPNEIALTDSTTMGLGVVYGGIRLAEGDHVLTTEHDFFSTHESLRLRAAQTGATVERVKLYDEPSEASADRIVSSLVERVTPRTRVIAVTWTHSGTGVKLPIAELGAAVGDVNDRRDERDRVLLCVDAVHAFGVETETPAELGIDVLVSGTHKWLFGPRGTGLVWVSPQALDRIDPVIPPFEGDSFQGWLDRRPPPPATDAARLSPGGFHSFEHRWALAEAFELHDAIGKPGVRDHAHEQATQLKQLLADTGIRVATPMRPELSSGIVCVELAPGRAFQMIGELREQGFGTGVTPYRNDYLRAGPSILTTLDDCEALAAAIADLA